MENHLNSKETERKIVRKGKVWKSNFQAAYFCLQVLLLHCSIGPLFPHIYHTTLNCLEGRFWLWYCVILSDIVILQYRSTVSTDLSYHSQLPEKEILIVTTISHPEISSTTIYWCFSFNRQRLNSAWCAGLPAYFSNIDQDLRNNRLMLHSSLEYFKNT